MSHNQMTRWFIPIGLMVTFIRPAHAEITADQVRDSIARGRSYLVSQQNKIKGNWPDHSGQPGAVTALCTLALIHSGDDPEAPHIQRSIEYLRQLDQPKMTYATALVTMAFCAATPEKDLLLIRRNAKLLESWQVRTGKRKGAWTYAQAKHRSSGDNSNAQFALLALHEAERVGVEISNQTWRLAHSYWVRTQRPEGAWGYYEGLPGTGSMTCAGITSLVITSGQLSKGDASILGGAVQCCGQQEQGDELERALQWMGTHFSASGNPTAAGQNVSRAWWLYYLYGVERVGRLTGRRFLGVHDWYRKGAKILVGEPQDKLRGYWKGTGHAESNPVIATSLALLFLSKGQRPVLIAKLKHGPDDDWNRHRSDIAHLTGHVEKLWKKDMTWQVIDPRAATVKDLLQSPVLFLSGRDGLQMSEQEKRNLRAYIDQGGFILAEACCNGVGFDRDFFDLTKQLFPDSTLRLLPPDHPIWFAEVNVDPKLLPPLYGLDACCRTSIVYCPSDLSCYWELGRGGHTDEYPEDVKRKVKASNDLGANILAYATGRELRSKLDIPNVSGSEGGDLAGIRGTLNIPKLQHGGGSDDAPAALTNLLRVLRDQLRTRVSTQRHLVAGTDKTLLDHPIVFMHGRRQFRFTSAERKALATYLERGGMIFADSICASQPFDESFRREMKSIFPDKRLRRVPPEHPMFTTEFHGFDLDTVTRRDPHVRAGNDPLKARLVKVAPHLEGIEMDGRYAVLFSPYDISCALENTPSLECRGYVTEDAARIGVNVILYALQQ